MRLYVSILAAVPCLYGQLSMGGAQSAEPLANRVVTGRPFSATEVRHTLQILADGTRIEKTDTEHFYRDDLGRTRLEGPNGAVSVRDPVRRMVNVKSASRENAAPEGAAQQAKREAETRIRTLAKTEIESQIALIESSIEGTVETLGTASINGVLTEGTRRTTTIGTGQIGNDRPIKTVSERWYSDYLQAVVKSSNSDPRFGETTFELTNIVQGAPDPALFRETR